PLDCPRTAKPGWPTTPATSARDPSPGGRGPPPSTRWREPCRRRRWPGARTGASTRCTRARARWGGPTAGGRSDPAQVGQVVALPTVAATPAPCAVVARRPGTLAPMPPDPLTGAVVGRQDDGDQRA